MSAPQPPPEPNKPLPELKVTRGFLLGLPIFAVLAVAAILLYLIAGALGWQGNTRIIIAMCGGPIIGFGLVGLYFYIARPKVI